MMREEMVRSVANNIVEIYLDESRLELNGHNDAEREQAKGMKKKINGAATDELVEQLTEHVIVEMTKILIKRSKREKPEEATGKTVDTVKKMCVEANDYINHVLRQKSNAELSSNIRNASAILVDAEQYVRAKKTTNALACISQARALLNAGPGEVE